MRIAFDARYIEKDGSGISVYAYHLLNYLAQNEKVKIFALTTEDQADLLPANDRLNKIISPYSIQDHPLQEYWLSIHLPRLLYKNNIDVLFCPAFIVPLRKLKIKMGVMIHDLAFHYVKHSMNRRFAIYVAFMTRMALRLSDVIITPTQTIKKEIEDLYKIKKDKIVAIHHGKSIFETTSNSQMNEQASKTFIENLGIKNPYFLFVGNLEPRKDIVRLLKLFQSLRKLSSFSHYQLVLCGKKRWKWNNIVSDAAENSQKVVFTDYVSKEELAVLYKKSSAVFATSVYEGFGFPVIEGMQAQKIVFASTIPCFQEVGANGAVYIDLGDLNKAAECVSSIMNDEKRKSDLAEQAKKRAGEFSWELSSKKTFEALQNIANK